MIWSTADCVWVNTNMICQTLFWTWTLDHTTSCWVHVADLPIEMSNVALDHWIEVCSVHPVSLLFKSSAESMDWEWYIVNDTGNKMSLLVDPEVKVVGLSKYMDSHSENCFWWWLHAFEWNELFGRWRFHVCKTVGYKYTCREFS